MKTAFLEVTSFEGFPKDFVSSSLVQSSRVNQDYANKGGRGATLPRALPRVAVGRLGFATEALGCRGCALPVCPSRLDLRLLLQLDERISPGEIKCTYISLAAKSDIFSDAAAI